VPIRFVWLLGVGFLLLTMCPTRDQKGGMGCGSKGDFVKELTEQLSNSNNMNPSPRNGRPGSMTMVEVCSAWRS